MRHLQDCLCQELCCLGVSERGVWCPVPFWIIYNIINIIIYNNKGQKDSLLLLKLVTMRKGSFVGRQSGKVFAVHADKTDDGAHDGDISRHGCIGVYWRIANHNNSVGQCRVAGRQRIEGEIDGRKTD